MTILIAGEGLEDIGKLKYEGDIKLILIALLKNHGWKGNDFGSENKKIRDAPKVHRRTEVHNAEIKKIINLIADAHWKKSQMCVVVIDARKERHKDLNNQVRKAETELLEHGNDKFMIGLAIHEIEAWILADPKARKAGLGEHAKHHKFSGKPEDDPDPKSSLKQLMGEILAENSGIIRFCYSTSEPEIETRKTMIENMRPKEVSNLCPLGFKPFYEKAKKAFIPLFVKSTPTR